jgi:hypothetical protein
MFMKHAFLLAFLAVGCGGGSTFSDAGAGGDDVDSATAEHDAGFGVVEVLVLGRFENSGVPIEGAPVLFHDAGGALIARAESDAEGRASAEVQGGGMVTVIDRDERVLTTVLGAQPGDQLVVGARVGPATAAGNATVNVPAGGTAYSVRGPCVTGSGSTTAIAAYVLDSCPGAAPVLALRNPSAPDAFLYAPDVTIGDGDTVDLPGSWQTIGSIDLDLGGFADGDVATVTAWLLVDGQKIAPIAASNTPTAVPYPTGIGDGTLLEATASNLTAGTFHRIVDHPGTAVTAWAVEAADLLPAPDLVAATGSGATWDAGGEGHDGTMVAIATMGEKGSSGPTWFVIAPPDAGEVDLPALPSDLAGEWSGFLFVSGAQVVAIDSSLVDGYDAFRAEPTSSSYVPAELTGPVQVRMASANQ